MVLEEINLNPSQGGRPAMVKGIIVVYNADKKEYEIFPVDVVEVTDAELNAIKQGNDNLRLEMYQTQDAYKALRFKKAVVPQA